MLVNHSPTISSAVLSSTDLIHLLAFAIITTHCAGTCTQFLPKGTMGALPDTEDLTFASLRWCQMPLQHDRTICRRCCQTPPLTFHVIWLLGLTLELTFIFLLSCKLKVRQNRVFCVLLILGQTTPRRLLLQVTNLHSAKTNIYLWFQIHLFCYFEIQMQILTSNNLPPLGKPLNVNCNAR